MTVPSLYPEDDPDACQITLNRGRIAYVDRVDYEWLASLHWTFVEGRRGCEGYVAHYMRAGGKTTMVYMHRMIMDAPPGIQVDHRNHRTLDNRRHNLRLATNQQNQYHRSVARNCKSGYKGVSQHKQNGNWLARISIPGGPYKHLGCFDTPEEAARAYNAKALELFGEYAYLNVIPKEEEL